MAKQEQGPMSGFRDLLAEQMIPREEVLDTIKGVYESYGFVPLKTPALERYETLTGKYGEEGESLMYHFVDHGNRHVAMRYDQTVPLARVVAQHSGKIPDPYKRYALADVWRGERAQAGRYREFMQFDADIVGSSSPLADAEIIGMMSDTMSALGLAAVVRVNDRRLLDGLATACGIDDEKGFRKLVGAIDKVEKIGQVAVLDEVSENFDDTAREVVEKYLTTEGTGSERLDQVSELLDSSSAQEGVDSLRQIFDSLGGADYSEETVVFDPSIARGLDYYTATVYETTLTDLPAIGSVCSGGRFDNLIKDLGGPEKPAVGTSVGVDRLLEAMRQLGVLKDVKTKTQIYIANVDPSVDPERFKLAKELRSAGIPTELWYENSKIGKQYRNIEKIGVTKVVLLGGSELAKGVVAVKDLVTGEQTEMTQEELIEMMKD